MSYYREVRVRPVVRYIVTLFEQVSDEGVLDGQNSQSLGEFANVDSANLVAAALYRDYMTEARKSNRVTVYEPARKLRIDWIRGPGEPQENIRWELSEVDPPGSRDGELRDVTAADVTEKG